MIMREITRISNLKRKLLTWLNKDKMISTEINI